jgi:L-rhamnose mutarotase
VISEVEISELLATLPFNVIDPDIREEEKEVIIDNYEILKQEFGVRELFDWSDVDPDQLGNKLAELDESGNSKRWQDVAEQIVEKTSEYDTAMYGGTKSDEVISD